MDPALEEVRRYLEAHRDRHLERVRTLLRQPSVSVDGEGVEACATLFVELLRDAGFPQAEIVPTPGYPGVWAAYDAGASVTLATYGMLDVRRADPTGWCTGPFDAQVVPMPPFPAVLVARGARAVKGPLGVWLNAVEACRAVLGAPPVNLVALVETDEILGSPHYRAMINQFRDQLAGATACWTPGASQDASGVAHLTLGYKGLIYLALRTTGARWGRGPRDGPIHGMAKAVVDSPAWRLVRALAALMGPDGNLVRLPGFNEEVLPPTAEEAAEMDAVMGRNRGVPWQRVLPGVQGALVPAIDGLSEVDIYRRYFFGPSVNLNGLRAGYQGRGTLTFTLPHTAEAILDIRLPRTWDVHDVLQALREHFDKAGFPDIELEVFGAFNGMRVATDTTIVQSARAIFDIS